MTKQPADSLKTVSADEQIILRGALAALEPFRQIDSTMPLQYVTAFLLVATDEGHSVTEYARRAGVSNSVMTRHLSDIGPVNRYHEEGYGLIEQEVDLLDRRAKKNRLSTKGRRVVGAMVRALQK